MSAPLRVQWSLDGTLHVDDVYVLGPHPDVDALQVAENLVAALIEAGVAAKSVRL